MRQVVTIHPTGTMSGLQVKPGKGLDLRKMGAAKIERASEVLFDEARQSWYVQIVRGRYAGLCITQTMRSMATGERIAHKARDPLAMFAEYEDAVACEIAVLDHIRLREGAEALA